MKNIAANIVISLGSVVLTLFLLEGVARIVVPASTEFHTIKYKPVEPHTSKARQLEETGGPGRLIHWRKDGQVRLFPGTKGVIKNHNLSKKDIAINVNSLGLRYRELAPKTEKTLRILLIGDSIVFGDYVQGEETLSALLEDYLDAEFPDRKIEVINAGLPGSNTNDELHHYLEIKDQVEPDIVLLAFYLNDSQESSRFYTQSMRKPYSYSRLLVWLKSKLNILNKKYFLRPPDREVNLAWREKFKAGRDLKTGHMYLDADAFDFEVYNAFEDFGRAWNPDSWERVAPIMEKFRKTVTEEGRLFASFILPIHLQFMGKVENYYPQEQFKRVCDTRDITCFDPLPMMRAIYVTDYQEKTERNEIMYDHCHYTPLGNQIVVKSLSPWVKNLVEQEIGNDTGIS